QPLPQRRDRRDHPLRRPGQPRIQPFQFGGDVGDVHGAVLSCSGARPVYLLAFSRAWIFLVLRYRLTNSRNCVSWTPRVAAFGWNVRAIGTLSATWPQVRRPRSRKAWSAAARALARTGSAV